MISSQAQNAIENAAARCSCSPRRARGSSSPRRSTSRNRPGVGLRRYRGAGVRTLVISDLHLGARLQNGVLTWPAPLRRLLAALEGVERLVLLGDSVELLEGAPAQAMETAGPCSKRSAAGWASGARSSSSPATTTGS